MNDIYDTLKKTSVEERHVIPILVTLSEEEWLEAQRFWPSPTLYFCCTRNIMEDESTLDHDTNFGDFIRWLFKLAPSDNYVLDLAIRHGRLEVKR